MNLQRNNRHKCCYKAKKYANNYLEALNSTEVKILKAAAKAPDIYWPANEGHDY